MLNNFTDTERLDYLQKLLDKKEYTGKVLLRGSGTGRGWRLHETSYDQATTNVREAIDNAMNDLIPSLKGVSK